MFDASFVAGLIVGAFSVWFHADLSHAREFGGDGVHLALRGADAPVWPFAPVHASSPFCAVGDAWLEELVRRDAEKIGYFV